MLAKSLGAALLVFGSVAVSAETIEALNVATWAHEGDESAVDMRVKIDGCVVNGKATLYKNQQSLFFGGNDCGLQAGDALLFPVVKKSEVKFDGVRTAPVMVKRFAIGKRAGEKTATGLGLIGVSGNGASSAK